jgi:hypothetical protein
MSVLETFARIRFITLEQVDCLQSVIVLAGF